MEEFSDWLEQQRKKKSWSVSELARQSGVKPASLSRVLNGTRQAGPDMCIGISNALGIPPERVFRFAGLLPPKVIGSDNYEQESELIDYYRNLNPDSKRAVLTLARALHEQQPTYTTKETEEQ